MPSLITLRGKIVPMEKLSMPDTAKVDFFLPAFSVLLIGNNLLSWKSTLFFSLLRITVSTCPCTIGLRKSVRSGLVGKI